MISHLVSLISYLFYQLNKVPVIFSLEQHAVQSFNHDLHSRNTYETKSKLQDRWMSCMCSYCEPQNLPPFIDLLKKGHILSSNLYFHVDITQLTKSDSGNLTIWRNIYSWRCGIKQAIPTRFYTRTPIITRIQLAAFTSSNAQDFTTLLEKWQ